MPAEKHGGGYLPRITVCWHEEDTGSTYEMPGAAIPARGDMVGVQSRRYRVRAVSWVYDHKPGNSLRDNLVATVHLEAQAP